MDQTIPHLQNQINNLGVLTDVLTIFIGIIALFLSILALLRSSAAVEAQINEMIAVNGDNVMKNSYTSKEDNYNHAREEYCNSFEFACSQYLGYRISRKQFRDLYSLSLIGLVESPSYKDFFQPEKGETSYTHIMKVYREIKKKL